MGGVEGSSRTRAKSSEISQGNNHWQGMPLAVKVVWKKNTQLQGLPLAGVFVKEKEVKERNSQLQGLPLAELLLEKLRREEQL